MSRDEIKPLRQLTEVERDSISLGYCPVCTRRGFVIGPMGGKSVNIECANIRCRERYNVAFYGGMAMMGHTLPPGPEWPSEPQDLEDKEMWSCGHIAGSVCAECHQMLVEKANELAAQLDGRDG